MRESIAEAQSIAEETYETLTTIANIVLSSLGGNVTTQGDLTGDKSQCSNLVHCKYIVRTWTMYLTYTHLVRHEYTQNAPC